jgi:hypothetical protein
MAIRRWGILNVMRLTPRGFYGQVSVRKQTWAAVENTAV